LDGGVFYFLVKTAVAPERHPETCNRSKILEVIMSTKTRFLLEESDIPKAWYNINADRPIPPAPVLHPGTFQPVTPDFLEVLFPMELILQVISSERYIPIPEEVREVYRLYRPTPLARARRLEKALDTPAHIYYKYEGASPGGSHKLNTAIPGILHQGCRHKSPTTEQALDSGDLLLRWQVVSSISTSKSTWSRSATTRSRTAGY
jgi:hypothetical protein